MKSNSFDIIAPLYDRLARFVYGDSIVESQKYFLPAILPNAKILILGGGTGWLLAEIVKRNLGNEVWYIEASKEMIRLTKQKADEPNIHFILGSENDIPTPLQFDVAITNFYLDLFTPDRLNTVIKKVAASLKPNALWIVSDFVHNKKWWQTILLKSMYIFFNAVCNIEASFLPDWQSGLQKNALEIKERKSFFNGFIVSILYQKIEKTCTTSTESD